MVRNLFSSSASLDVGALNTKDYMALKITNVVVFWLFFGSNLYSTFGWHGGHIYGRDTYITPADYVFQIWGLIVFLLFGFVIYQFFEAAKPALLGIGWRFAILAVLNAIFVHVWVTGYYLIAFVVSLFVASAVSFIYHQLVTKLTARTDIDTIVVHLPFSLWHAWSIVLVLISGFSAFAPHHGNDRHPNGLFLVLALAAEGFLALTCLGYVFQSKKGDLAGAIVLAWTLFGISDRQHNDLVSYFALGSGIFCCVAIFKALYYTFVDGNGSISLGDSERAPLIA